MVSRRSLVMEPENELSLQFFGLVFAQWWKALICISLLLLVISTGLIFLFCRPEFRATALLLVRSDPPFIAFPDEPDHGEGNHKFVATQIELLRDESVLGQVVAQPEIAQLPDLARQRDPVRWLATDGLEIRPRGDSELLEVACSSRDPNAAKEIVNAVVGAYLDTLSERRYRRESQIKSVLQELKAVREPKVKELRRLIREKQAMIVANDPSMISGALRTSDIVIADHPLKSVQENLGKAKIDQEVVSAQVRALESSVEAGADVPDVLVERQIDQRPEIQELTARLNQRRAALDQIQLARVRGKEDPAYERGEAEVQQLEKSLESLRNTIRPQMRKVMQAYADLDRQQQLDETRMQLATKSLVVEKMRENYNVLLEELRSSGDQSMQLHLDQAELARQQRVLDQILERKEQLETEDSAPERVELVREALTPKLPEKSAPWNWLLIALTGSFSVPFAICVLWERFVKRVNTIEQLRREALMPVVGEIARLPVRNARHMLDTQNSLEYELGSFEESVDSLRTGLMLAHEEEPIQVVAVTSAVSGEGKSSIASQLAVSLARSSGHPTLLIDGDMRSPDLHQIFQIELTPGLAEVLSGKYRIADCINRDWSDQVHILPAGDLMKSPHKLLGGGRFKTLVEWARRRYRYVVVDTPPILAASESMVMAQGADGTLVCAMRALSREGHVKMTLERLRTVGVRPIGTVLSGVPTRQYARRYGSYVYTKK